MARRHTPDQVIAKVRQGQKMLNEHPPLIEVLKELEVTEATWYWWLIQYGGEKNAESSKRLKELEKESAQLSSCWPIRFWPTTSWARSPRENSKPRTSSPCRAHASREVRGIRKVCVQGTRVKPRCAAKSQTRYQRGGTSASRLSALHRVQISGLGLAQGALAPAGAIPVAGRDVEPQARARATTAADCFRRPRPARRTAPGSTPRAASSLHGSPTRP